MTRPTRCEMQTGLDEAEYNRMREVRYTVQGKGDFPLDMLRYDASFPLGNIASYDGLWEVELAHRCKRSDWNPTIERWRSFGWSVIAGSARQVPC